MFLIKLLEEEKFLLYDGLEELQTIWGGTLWEEKSIEKNRNTKIIHYIPLRHNEKDFEIN